MATPLISLTQANRFLLSRQHLLQSCDDPVGAVRDACGLQAQIPSTPAASLRARVRGFALADYDRLVAVDRNLVRTWAMRGTVHVVPSDRLAMYTRVYEPHPWPEAGLAKTLEFLADGPLTRAGLAQRAMSNLGIPPDEAERMFSPWGGILRSLAAQALTVHVPVEGPDVPVARTVDWLGYEPEPTAVEGLEDALLRDYLHGYGPAALQDFAYFTLFSATRVRAIFARAADLVAVKVEGSRHPQFVLAEDLPALLATTGAERAPVQLLPRFDSLLLAYKDKARLLDESQRTQVFRIAAQVEATVLVGGRVAGTWTARRTARELRFRYFPFTRRAAGPVEREARRLADWYGLERLAFQVETK